MAEEFKGSGRPATSMDRKHNVRIASRPAAGTDLSSYVFGKLPPQARDLEEAVLGALMIDKDAVTAVIDILRPECFYVESHKVVYHAIYDLFEHNEAIDILTVTEALKKKGQLEDAGGAFAVAEFTTRVASAANVEYHARIILQKYIQRELISICTDIVTEAYEDTTDVLDLLDKAEKNLFSVADQNLRRNFQEMSTLITQAIHEIQEVRNKEDQLTGIASGFTGLDRVTSGWQRSDLIVVAARPGMGKTAFTLAMARNAAVDWDKPVALFSLEMSSVQLVKRLISMETELTGDKIRKGNLADHEWVQLTKMTGKLGEAPIYIDDTPAINIFELRAKCRRLKKQHDIQMIIIDYLQLMAGAPNSKAGNREQEISNISRSLKSIAKELQVPVIALSQLSRAVETRGGLKKPQLSDLRESGAIEQDADLVIFLYRPEYYGFTEDEEGNPAQGTAEVIIAKHRNGALENVRVRFIDKFAKFCDMELSSMDGFSQLSDHMDDGASNFITHSSRMDQMDDSESESGDVPF